MNRLVSRIGAGRVSVTVFLFAVFLIVDFTFGSYFVCMLLPIGYIMTAAGLHNESPADRKAAANIGLVLAGVYAVLILLVYFAQTTSVRNDSLNEQARSLLDFRYMSLIFNYDLLGYGMMALSTLFIGLSVKPEDTADKWMKRLLIIHGAFFPGCFLMPIFGVFTKGHSSGQTSKGGVIALVIWCIYFLPIGLLAFRHFRKK